MSSASAAFDLAGRTRAGRLSAALALLLLGPAVAGCQIRPLYAEGPGRGASAQLAVLALDAPDNRVEQVFRNAFLAGRGSEPDNPGLRMGYDIALNVQQVGIQQVSGTPTFYTLGAVLTYAIRDEGGRAVIEGRETASASFSRSTQSFANIRAERDAEDRVARALAGQVEDRIAAFLAGR